MLFRLAGTAEKRNDSGMSRRLLKADAVVLKSVKFGEIHRRLTLLTDTEGILYVNAYGAAKGKSKLAGIVLPFSYLQVNLYFDPVKQGYKLTDAYPVRMHGGIHESLRKYYAASAAAEVLLKSFGGGERVPFFSAAAEVLTEIEHAEEGKVVYPLLQFFWRFILMSGLAPDLQECSRCGGLAAGNGDVYIDVVHHEAYCASCIGGGRVRLNRGAVQYLEHTKTVPFTKGCRVLLDRATEQQVFDFLKAYLEAVIEGPIVSLVLWEEQK